MAVTIQKGQVSLTTTQSDITIDAVTLSNAIVKLNYYFTSTYGSAANVGAYFVDTTTVRLIRANDNGTCVVDWEVIENPLFSVTHGTTTIASGTAETTATISSVTLGDTFVVATSTVDSGTTTNNLQDGEVVSFLETATSLTFLRYSTAANIATVYYQIVTYSGATVQTFFSRWNISPYFAGTSYGVSLTAVNLEHTYAILSQSSNSTPAGRSSCAFTSTTSLTLYSNSSYAKHASVYVISHPEIYVRYMELGQYGRYAVSNIKIPLMNESSTSLIYYDYGGTTTALASLCASLLSFTNDNTMNYQAVSNNVTSNSYRVFFVEYESNYQISGVVTNQSVPVEGAKVTVLDSSYEEAYRTTYTNVSGEYLFNTLENKEYHVIVEYEDESTNKYNTTSYPFVTPKYVV